MDECFHGLEVAMLGGDDRDRFLARALVEQGAAVRSFGLPGADGVEGAERCSTPLDAATGARVLIAPITGTDREGWLRHSESPARLDEELLSRLEPPSLLVVGSLVPVVARACGSLDVGSIETARDDEVAILNSIPSAEGAIYMAMEEIDITIHRSSIMVLGFGRTGTTLARICLALGAQVHVAARRHSHLARAYEAGYAQVPFDRLEQYVREMDILFNTVPSLVVTREILHASSPDLFILDLASPPGGVDFDAAREVGRRAVLAPGLPGRVAPRTAGQILARTVPRRIQEWLSAHPPG